MQQPRGCRECSQAVAFADLANLEDGEASAIALHFAGGAAARDGKAQRRGETGVGENRFLVRQERAIAPAGVAETTHEPLGDHERDGAAHEIRGQSHFFHAYERLERIGAVQGGQHEVTGERGAACDSRALGVADLADE